MKPLVMIFLIGLVYVWLIYTIVQYLKPAKPVLKISAKKKPNHLKIVKTDKN